MMLSRYLGGGGGGRESGLSLPRVTPGDDCEADFEIKFLSYHAVPNKSRLSAQTTRIFRVWLQLTRLFLTPSVVRCWVKWSTRESLWTVLLVYKILNCREISFLFFLSFTEHLERNNESMIKIKI